MDAFLKKIVKDIEKSTGFKINIDNNNKLKYPVLPIYEIPQQYRELVSLNKKITVIEGGRGGAKTTSILAILIEDSFKIELQNSDFLIAREYQKNVQESIKKELEDKIKMLPSIAKHFDFGHSEIINKTNNVRFVFHGLRDYNSSTTSSKQSNLAKIKGYSRIKRIHLEEAQTISIDSLKMLIPTVRSNKILVSDNYKDEVLKELSEHIDEDVKIFATMNAIKEQDPIKEYIVGRQDAVLKEINLDDLDVKFKDNILLKERAEMQNNPLISKDEFTHIWYNKPLPELAGIPFKNLPLVNDYTFRNPIIYIDPSLRGVDFTAIALGEKNEDTFYITGFMFKEPIEKCVDKIKQIAYYYNTNYVYYENNITGSWLGEESLKEFIAYGIHNTKNKEDRIYGKRIFKINLVTSNILTEYSKTFIKNVLSYEKGIKNDDGADALAGLIERLND